jgi:hypothetical protein
MEDNKKAKEKVLGNAKKSIPCKASLVMSNHTGKEPQQAKTPIKMTKTTDDEGAGGQFGRRAHMSKNQ